MSRELEAVEYFIETIRMFGENQIGLDNYEERYNTIKQALERLKAIDNANPSEALKCLERIEADLVGLPKHVTEYDDIFDDYLDDIEDNIDTIKQALLKAQEPKKYLKWEDLEFDNNAQVKKYLKVKLGDNIYKAYYHFCFLLNSELFCIENANENLNIYITNKHFFNDLHLERVEE